MKAMTIHIGEEMKARVADSAQRTGKTAHGFIVDAINEAVERVELDEVFHDLADQRWAKLLATGETISWDAAKDWLEARARK